jgi:hypothetical protein
MRLLLAAMLLLEALLRVLLLPFTAAAAAAAAATATADVGMTLALDTLLRRLPLAAAAAGTMLFLVTLLRV